MFKSAYARGVQNALIQGGHVAFPSEDDACKVADFIASRLQFDPLNEAITHQKTAEIAEAVIDASNWYKQQGVKSASFQKLASVEDLGKLAHVHALHLMQKAAEGSNIEGGDKGNKEPSTAEGQMDAKNRPEGYAEDSRGKTEVDTRPGAVGKEQTQPAAPTNTPAGDNSVVEQSRTAALGSLINKLAEGSTILGGDKGNSMPTSAEGKMDATNRPTDYARLPSQGALGALMSHVSGPAIIGKEIPQPNKPNESPAGTNSAIQQSQKAAQEDPYLSLFKKTAAELVPYLPGNLTEDQKIAHVRACMGLTMEEKAHYVHGIQKEAADKTAPQTAPSQGHYDGRNANQRKVAEDSGMPPFIQAKMDAKKDDDKDEKKDDDKDEKKEEKKEDEKQASLRDYLRRISASVQTSA
jgi:hypothetical protein